MKRILVLIFVLLIAIVTMAYLYFSGLNAEKKNNDNALYTAAAGASFIFSFQNDKSILDILTSQTLLSEMIGSGKSDQLKSLYQHLLKKTAIGRAADKQNVYISLLPGNDNTIDFLYITQFNTKTSLLPLTNTLKSSGIQLDTVEKLTRLVLPDSNTFFLAFKDQLILLSSSAGTVRAALSAPTTKNNRFAEFISSTNKLAKNSIAEVYVDFNNLPKLLRTAIPENLNGNLSVFNNQNAFASLVYNYSADKILFSGTTTLNDTKNYYSLYTSLQPKKITINSILPQNTANYTVYTIGDYTTWSKRLQTWFTEQQFKKLQSLLGSIQKKYHLDPEQIFPKYFRDQLITFQLSTGENIGAITLTNGEKFEQLLIDISTSAENEVVKSLKEPDLLYYFFGEPFKKFKRPFYVIIDNYMVFANNISTIQSFLNSYKNDRLLIANPEYINSINQLPNTSGITFFIDFKNSSDIFLRNVHLPYYKQFHSERGLKSYSSFICQLSGEQDKFQTNVLLNKLTTALKTDSLMANTDSLKILPDK